MHIRCLVLPLLALVLPEARSFRAVALRVQMGVARGRRPSSCGSGTNEAAQRKIISFSERALAQVHARLWKHLFVHLSGVVHRTHARPPRISLPPPIGSSTACAARRLMVR